MGTDEVCPLEATHPAGGGGATLCPVCMGGSETLFMSRMMAGRCRPMRQLEPRLLKPPSHSNFHCFLSVEAALMELLSRDTSSFISGGSFAACRWFIAVSDRALAPVSLLPPRYQ